MPFVYREFRKIVGLPKVDGGECARLVQHFMTRIGKTSQWRAGERVLDIIASGRQLEPGTAVATFVKGRYPTIGHRHAAFYEGPAYNAKGALLGIILVDQWNPKATTWNPHPAPRDEIKRRTAQLNGKMRPDGTFPLISDNAEAFYVIER